MGGSVHSKSSHRPRPSRLWLLAREQVDVARRELTARARQAGPGVAMVGGGALLAALASGTGTAALILLLARRPGASAAALGVTGAYAGAGAFLARGGLVRLRQSRCRRCPTSRSQDEPVRTPSKTSDLRSDAPSRQRSRRDAARQRRSRQRSGRVARSRSKVTKFSRAPLRPQTDRRQAS